MVESFALAVGLVGADAGAGAGAAAALGAGGLEFVSEGVASTGPELVSAFFKLSIVEASCTISKSFATSEGVGLASCATSETHPMRR